MCILQRCAHFKGHACESLGCCGAGYVLDRARYPVGYNVILRDNPTISALNKAGLVKVRELPGGIGIVRAV